MRKLLHVGLVVGAVGMAVAYGGGGATAGQDPCHEVTLSSSPNPVNEGETVRITVRRGGISGTTIFRIRTVDGSAAGGTGTQTGKDYPSFNEKLTWTPQNADIAKHYDLVILNDSVREGEETFRVELSEPGGSEKCTPVEFRNNPMTVRIRASDQTAPPPTAPPPARTSLPTPRTTTTRATPAPTASPTVSPSPSPSPTPTPTPLATFTPFPTVTPSADDDDGLSGLDIAGIAIGAGALASGGLLWYLRSRGML